MGKTYLAFEGGGGKGAAYLAVVQAIEELGLKDKFDGYSGSSAGAITALLLSLKTESSLLKQITQGGFFNNVLPKSDPYSKSWHPFWRGFVQTQTRTGKVMQYCKINAPKTVKSQYAEMYNIVSGEFLEKYLFAGGLILFGLAPLTAMSMILVDKQNLLKDIIQQEFLETDKLAPFHLTAGSISNMISTGGLFSGEEVFDMALYLTAIAKKNKTFAGIKDWTQLPEYVTAVNENKRHVKLLGEFQYTIGVHGVITVADQSMQNKTVNTQTLPSYYNNAIGEKAQGVYDSALTGTLQKYELDETLQYTFADHFAATGKAVAFTSVNLVNGVTYYFSAESTPDLPVALGVAMSMNLPMWSPIYLQYTSPAGVKYDGWFFDGGINNNFPLGLFKTNWENYPTNYKRQDVINVATPSGDNVYMGFILDDSDNEQYLNYLPSAMGIGGALAGMKLEQSTLNQYHSWQKVCKLKTTGLSTYNFSPPNNFFGDVNTNNKKAVVDFFKKNGL